MSKLPASLQAKRDERTSVVPDWDAVEKAFYNTGYLQAFKDIMESPEMKGLVEACEYLCASESGGDEIQAMRNVDKVLATFKAWVGNE